MHTLTNKHIRTHAHTQACQYLCYDLTPRKKEDKRGDRQQKWKRYRQEETEKVGKRQTDWLTNRYTEWEGKTNTKGERKRCHSRSSSASGELGSSKRVVKNLLSFFQSNRPGDMEKYGGMNKVWQGILRTYYMSVFLPACQSVCLSYFLYLSISLLLYCPVCLSIMLHPDIQNLTFQRSRPESVCICCCGNSHYSSMLWAAKAPGVKT